MTARQLATRPHPDDRIDPAKRGPQTMRQVTVNIAESPIAWLAAGLLAVLAAPALLRLADKVFATARNERSERTIPNTGESFL